MVATLSFFAFVGCATTQVIAGSVIDRNGEAVDRAIVTVSPGNVEIITDRQGSFAVDYLRDEAGERTKLERRTDYTVEVFKPGYHLGTSTFYFKKGELLLEPLTLKEDTIRVVGSSESIDPALYPDRSHSSGANYEGE